MSKRMSLLTAAVAATLAAPAVAHASLPHGVFRDWSRSNGGRRLSSRVRRSVSSLQRRGWDTQPCDAPEGYFWKQDALGKAWRLYALPPTQGRSRYDALFDRTIHTSGWGYVKPTYSPGR